MSSASSPVKQTLEAYLAGRVPAERVVAAVVTAYYGDEGRGSRAALGPVVEIIERAAPGVVELAGGGAAGGPGFQVRLAERPFPRAFEGDLKRAAEAVLAGAVWEEEPGREARDGGRGIFARVIGAVRRLFSASR